MLRNVLLCDSLTPIFFSKKVSYCTHSSLPDKAAFVKADCHCLVLVVS